MCKHTHAHTKKERTMWLLLFLFTFGVSKSAIQKAFSFFSPAQMKKQRLQVVFGILIFSVLHKKQ